MSSSTLTSAMHRSQHPHPAYTPPPTLTSAYHQRSHSQTAIATPSSPPPSTHRSRRPSLSNTMHWLSRSSPPASTSPLTYAPASKPIRISEPKRVRGIDALSPRSGTLGSGATVVRTPDDALRETGVRLVPEVIDISRSSLAGSRTSVGNKDETPGTPHLSYHAPTEASVSPPTSPPLPPLPLPTDTDEETLNEPESPTEGKAPPRPSRTPPLPASHARISRSSLKVRTISAVEEAPTVPPLPANIIAFNKPPPFHAILVSDPPPIGVDASKVIVTIETCTSTHKTTLSTIQSRPSHLSKYLSRVMPHGGHQDSIVSSIYSTESDDLHTYHRHLTSQGLIPQSCNIHIFLDRASFSYSHILNFLRSPVIEGQADILPRSLQLHGSSASPQVRLEALIEVREEAAFLGLESLHKLATDEIRLRYGPRLHVRGQSNSSGISVHSLHASVYSQHPRAENGDIPTSPVSGAFSHSPSDVPSPPVGHTNTPYTPQIASPDAPGMEGPSPTQPHNQHQQSQPRQSLKSPPAGWI